MNTKILIVEDEESLCNVLADTFKDEGFKVETASDGKAGLKQAIEFKPDIILLDVMLPKMDGMEMLRQLREPRCQ